MGPGPPPGRPTHRTASGSRNAGHGAGRRARRIEPVRRRRRRRCRGPGARASRASRQRLSHLRGNLVLNVEEIAEPAVGGRRADDRGRPRVEHPGGYAEAVSDALVGAGYERGGPESPAGLDDGLRQAQTHLRSAGQRRRLRAHGRNAGAIQVGCEALGDARADPVIRRVARDIDEGENGNRSRGRARAGAGLREGARAVRNRRHDGDESQCRECDRRDRTLQDGNHGHLPHRWAI